MGTKKKAGKPKKKKKLESNRFENTVKDYVRTNSQFTDENKKRIEEAGGEKSFWKAPLSNFEKCMLLIIGVGLVLIFVKYVIL